MTDNFSVAVLGTGIMGAAMARNLAGAGLEVRAWNRTRARAEPLAADGVTVVDTPAEAVADADVVLTVLLDGPAVLDAVRQAAPGLRAGAVWTQCATVGPQALAPLVAFARDHKLRFVDAPVLGTRAPAESGRLTVLAAGPQDAREAADQVFAAIGQRTVWLAQDAAEGPAGRLKLVLNNWVLTLVNGTAESLALAKGLGVDPRAFLEAVEGGPLDSPYLRMKAEAILTGDYRPQFALSGGLKDARLIAEAAERAGVRLDLAPAGRARLERAQAQGHGEEDCAASYFAAFDH
ncbi:NAD(P)-dependent oxidoreductase [Streptomyces sp. MST-110588]|uniref:NAD(P)-dependent oxidoreductase n=1 Tax=Streptomyces sp. MST-110588 TaxID=2833628 RepID=UPI001F5C73ED|nr:NAD(P)-dependent oxidoreductase [Streptomyces sp. MST-110588]UNO42247.1 NAD(P)-dependent oxidoreductase [Streptomyces sp. MST-110588]